MAKINQRCDHHITFKKLESDHYCTGKSYHNTTVIEALEKFNIDFPNVIFLAIVDTKSVNKSNA